MAILSSNDFLESERQAKAARLESALSSGPVFQGRKNNVPVVWYDQYFARDVNPTGTISAPLALRVGGTQNSLDVVILACHNNANDLAIPAGASFKFELLQSAEPDGTFTAVGREITYKFTAADTIPADHKVARVSLENTDLPWVKIKVTVTGNITGGGNVDIGIAYMPR